MYRQTDKRWAKEFMTSPADLPKADIKDLRMRWEKHADGLQGDTIGRWGCLVTALTNVYNSFFKTDFTPSYFNHWLRKNDCYNVLKMSYDCPVGQESYLDLDLAKIVYKYRNYREIDIKYIDINSLNSFYILRCPYSPPKIMSGHYNMIIDYNKDTKIIKHFDSDSGAIRIDYEKNKNYRIIEILF